jgi:hypothetical protein
MTLCFPVDGSSIGVGSGYSFTICNVESFVVGEVW